MIVVGVDKSDEAERALRWAVGEARARGTCVQAVYAFQPPVPTGKSYIPPRLLEPTRLQARALEILSDTAEPVVRDNPDVTIGCAATEGLAVPVLCKAAKHAELLVVGSGNYGRMRSLVTGSVSHQCMSHALCPVVVVT